MNTALWIKQYLFWLVLVAGCLLLGPWNEAAMDGFGMRRSALQNAEYWRFFTGHLVHSSWSHLAINLAALVVLQQLFGRALRQIEWVWGYAFIGVAIGICLLAFSRFGSVYGSVYGLSGLLHGLFVFAACRALTNDVLMAAGVLLLIAVKVGWEQINGGSAFMAELIGMPIATDAHLYGALAGAVLGALLATSARSVN